jgi:signal transduction histidine kinase
MTPTDFLEQYRHDIAHAWAARVLAAPASQYREWPPDEIEAWAIGALDAAIEWQRTGSDEVIRAHALALSRARAAQHFEIDQVIEGLLLLAEAALPFAAREDPRADGRADVVIRDLFTALRLMAASFATTFADAMRTQQERVAVLEERQRLARELHDSVSQSIYGVQMYAEAAARLLDAGQIAAAAAHLADVRDSASEALREMRFLIFDLRPSILRDEGLVAALQARLAAVETRVGVKATLAMSGDVRLAPDVEEALYGVAREALNNGVKHSHATHIEVRLNQRLDETTIEIVDNGVGFSPESARSAGGLGLQGMKERAARIHARLVIESRPGHGARVSVTVPRVGARVPPQGIMET